MSKKRTRRVFSREFQLEAVLLVRQGGRSIAAVARELGIHQSSLDRWLRQYDIDQGKGTKEGALTTDEREELRRLRRENQELREERDILGKATAFFAKKSR